MKRRKDMVSRGRALVVLAAALALTAAGTLGAQEEEGPIAKVETRDGAVIWHPVVEYARLDLVVSGQGTLVERSYKPGGKIVLEVGELAKAPRDGRYDWELRRTPEIDPEVRERLTKARAEGDSKTVDELRRRGLLPKGPFVQTGSFTLADGRPAQAETSEASSGRDPRLEGSISITGDLMVEGAKKFRMADPDDPSREIHFSALEGPEVGTYYRGSAELVAGEAVIDLPESFAKATESEGLTVQLTPTGGWARLYVAELSPARLVVREAGGAEGARFDFLVQGVRVGFAGFEVDRPVDRDP